MKHPLKGIFIDLDGTLVDSAPDLHDALNYSLSEIGYGPYDIKQTRQWIGNGLDLLLHRALTGDFNGIADDSLLTRSRDLFLEKYSETNGLKSRLYDGVIEALQTFNKAGIKIACLTNKNKAFAKPLLDRLEVLNYFDLVLGGDDVAVKKPDPEMLITAREYFNLSSMECLMIGDSDNDIFAANRAGIDVIGVSYGYSQGVDLSQLPVFGMVGSMADISLHNQSF